MAKLSIGKNEESIMLLGPKEKSQHNPESSVKYICITHHFTLVDSSVDVWSKFMWEVIFEIFLGWIAFVMGSMFEPHACLLYYFINWPHFLLFSLNISGLVIVVTPNVFKIYPILLSFLNIEWGGHWTSRPGYDEPPNYRWFSLLSINQKNEQKGLCT